MRKGNLFADTSPPLEGERFETLVRHRNLRIERILSSEAISPSEYVQAQDEWVVLLRGEAELRVAGESVVLAPGDYLFLPAGTPHTVTRVSAGALWLAVHFYPEPTAQ
jgi:cupin 2 domain-containing protein